MSRLNIDAGLMIEEKSFSELLKSHYEIMTPSKELINAIGNQDPIGELGGLLKGDKIK